MKSSRYLTLLVGLTVFTPGTAGAASTYTVQRIAKFGDRLGEVVIGGHFDIGALNENGQIAFVTESAAGGQLVIQYSSSDGKLTPIVVPGQDAPGGKWGAKNVIVTPVSMNQLGNVVFGSDVVVGNQPDIGTFLWDVKAQKVTAVALRGMPAVDTRTFEQGANTSASINNFNDIAFAPMIKNAAGEKKQGVFLLRRDGTLQAIALPGDARPGGGTFASAGCPYVNDAGRIGFAGRQAGEKGPSVWVWEKGTIIPVAVLGSDAPGGGKVGGADGALVNDQNQNLLAAVQADLPDGPNGLYRFADGQLAPVAVPGREMPGGGILKSVQVDRRGISVANIAGQHAFLATLAGGSTAVYRVAADGQLSLLLKNGTMTDLGEITTIGSGDIPGKPEGIGVGFNSKGQIAVSVKINGGVTTLVLLTPAAP